MKTILFLLLFPLAAFAQHPTFRVNDSIRHLHAAPRDTVKRVGLWNLHKGSGHMLRDSLAAHPRAFKPRSVDIPVQVFRDSAWTLYYKDAKNQKHIITQLK